MRKMKHTSDIWLKAVLSGLLFFGTVLSGVAQSEAVMVKDSIVYDSFFATTNDELYWNGKGYNCSVSPLYTFTGYDMIEDFFPELLCETFYENRIDDKQYIIFWTIIDSCLYLCDDMVWVCTPYDIILPTIKDYQTAFQEKRTFDDWRVIRLIPLEELIGRKFRKKFPSGIYNYPSGSGYVVAADWFNGELDVLNMDANPYGPYQRLTFKAGKLISVRQLNYVHWKHREWLFPRVY